jgi:hypothetical protein
MMHNKIIMYLTKHLLFVILITSIVTSAKSQNHIVGTGLGISDFEPPVYITYQFNYKLINSKFKASLLPIGLWTTPMSSSYDLYLGIKTKEEKRNIFSLNAGITLFNPKPSRYKPSIKQQVNPIINFEYAFAFNANHRFTSNLSFSQYVTLTHNLNGNDKNYNVTYLIIEIGYAFRFKRKPEDVKSIN